MVCEYMLASGGWDKIAWKSFRSVKIPWGMIAPHNEQAKKNHCDQDLVRLAQRGGLSPCEALAILDDRKWHQMELGDAYRELEERIVAYNKTNCSKV